MPEQKQGVLALQKLEKGWGQVGEAELTVDVEGPLGGAARSPAAGPALLPRTLGASPSGRPPGMKQPSPSERRVSTGGRGQAERPGRAPAVPSCPRAGRPASRPSSRGGSSPQPGAAGRCWRTG